jgi:hypothetical protein
MSTRISKHIRGNFVGYIAIFLFAIGGSAYATHGAPNSISTEDIIDLQVQAADIGTGAVTNTKLGTFSVSSTKVAPSAISSSSKVANDVLTSSDLAAGAVGSSEVADGSLGTAEFASSVPAVHATRSSSQGIPNNAATKLNLTSERYDTANMHSTSSNLSRLTAPVTGIYAVSASVLWSSFGSGKNTLNLSRNGTALVGASTASGGDANSISVMVRLVAGDYVEVAASQNSGSTQSVAGSPERSPQFSMTWLAPGP